MSSETAITFVMKGRVEGREITPANIGFSRFNEFNKEVADFLVGSQRLDLDDVHVSVEEGSYMLRTLLPALVLSSVEPDLKLMAREDVLGEMDPKRSEIVKKWQDRSKNNPDLSYEMLPAGEGLSKIRISQESDYRIGAIVPWVTVEKYLFGEILDMGGSQKANIHIKTRQSSKLLKVGTNQDYLRDQPENRLYHKALLQVRAEQHFRTGELRNIQLISFVDYRPVYDEEAMKLFETEGARAWADVPDAAAWVREVRGG